MAAERTSIQCTERVAAHEITKKRAQRQDPLTLNKRGAKASDQELAAEIVRAHRELNGIKPALLKQVLAFKRRFEASCRPAKRTLENHGAAEGSCGPPLPKIPRVGSICSGLYTGGFAMRNDKFDHVTEFVAEKQDHLRTFIQDNFPDVNHFFKDCTSRSFLATAPPVDILEVGFPCQPFSAAGLNKGGKDPRCVHNQILEHVKKHLPRLVILENVKGLLSENTKRCSNTYCTHLTG